MKRVSLLILLSFIILFLGKSNAAKEKSVAEVEHEKLSKKRNELMEQAVRMMKEINEEEIAKARATADEKRRASGLDPVNWEESKAEELKKQQLEKEAADAAKKKQEAEALAAAAALKEQKEAEEAARKREEIEERRRARDKKRPVKDQDQTNQDQTPQLKPAVVEEPVHSQKSPEQAQKEQYELEQQKKLEEQKRLDEQKLRQQQQKLREQQEQEERRKRDAEIREKQLLREQLIRESQKKQQQALEQQAQTQAALEKQKREQQLKEQQAAIEKQKREQLLKDQQAALEKQKEQLLKEQQLKEQQLKEQQAAIEKQKLELQLKEQQLKEQQLKEQQVAVEKQKREQQLKEQQMKDQAAREREIREKQRKIEELKKQESNSINSNNVPSITPYKVPHQRPVYNQPQAQFVGVSALTSTSGISGYNNVNPASTSGVSQSPYRYNTVGQSTNPANNVFSQNVQNTCVSPEENAVTIRDVEAFKKKFEDCVSELNHERNSSKGFRLNSQVLGLIGAISVIIFLIGRFSIGPTELRPLSAETGGIVIKTVTQFDEHSEEIVLVNTSSADVEMTACTVVTPEGHSYQFDDGYVFAKKTEVTIYSGENAKYLKNPSGLQDYELYDSRKHNKLYWTLHSVWKPGQVAELRDSRGQKVCSKIVT